MVLIASTDHIQVYFNAALTYGLMKLSGVEHDVASPGALIGASNFFRARRGDRHRAVRARSGAALATVVGVLVEVPVMLSVRPAIALGIGSLRWCKGRADERAHHWRE